MPHDFVDASAEIKAARLQAGPKDPTQAIASSPKPSTDFAELLRSKIEETDAPSSNGFVEKSGTQEAFEDFVGQTFYSQMLASLRSTQGEAAYFDGGQAEKIFRGQFDQYISEYLSDASAEEFATPMFEAFSR